jgi:hypothetical protein
VADDAHTGLDDHLAAMRAIRYDDAPVAFHGAHTDFSGIDSHPRPTGRIPIVIGGRGATWSGAKGALEALAEEFLTHSLVHGNCRVRMRPYPEAADGPVADTAPSLSLSSIAFAASNPSILYATTGEVGNADFEYKASASMGQYLGAGLLKSVDGGETWSEQQVVDRIKDARFGLIVRAFVQYQVGAAHACDVAHFNFPASLCNHQFCEPLNFPRTKIRIRDYNQRGHFPISCRG